MQDSKLTYSESANCAFCSTTADCNREIYDIGDIGS